MADETDTPPTTPRTMRYRGGWVADITVAFGFLTRLPVGDRETAPDGLARALRFGPIAGALVGGCTAAAYTLTVWAGIAPFIAALIAVATAIFLTGALHEDGLADIADGFGGGWNKARKLEIMGDSRIGTYGTLALIISVSLRAALISDLATPERVLSAMICAGALSRAAMYAAMRLLPDAKSEGLAQAAGKPTIGDLLLCAALALAICLVALPAGLAAAAIFGTTFGACVVMLIAYRQISGATGDVLGGIQQIAEISCLLALVAIFGN